MELANDFTDFINLLNQYKAEYMVVGGYAVMAHGHPRYTEDFDIWIKPSPDNAKKMMLILKDFGFALQGLSEKEFETEDMVVQLGYAPLRIDILGSISGVTFEDAYRNKVVKKMGTIEAFFIGMAELIKNKEATARQKDIADAEKLKKLIIKKEK